MVFNTFSIIKQIQMKQSGRSILLKYFGTVTLLFALVGFSLYNTVRRSRVGGRAITSCIATTTVIATSLNKLTFLILFSGINEASTGITNLP